MRMLHFVDTAGTDECFVNSEKITLVQVTSTSNINVYFPSNDPAVTANDVIALTCTTGKTDEVSLRLADYMAATNHGGASVLTVLAATAPFADVSAVAYTAGT
jgi:hypothetical protein